MLKSLAKISHLQLYVVGCSTPRVHMGLGSSIASTKQLAMAERCSITNTKVRHLGAVCIVYVLLHIATTKRLSMASG